MTSASHQRDTDTNTQRMTQPDAAQEDSSWAPHLLQAGQHRFAADNPPADPGPHRRQVEPWLAALLQTEHLSLLIGSGLTLAVSHLVGAEGPGMGLRKLDCTLAQAIQRRAAQSASSADRCSPNLEDQVTALRETISGLRALRHSHEALGLASENTLEDHLASCEQALKSVLSGLRSDILEAEAAIASTLAQDTPESDQARHLLGSFLLTFASRAATRERLHIFTTNYDRLIEYGCDVLGLRLIDRFVGMLEPVFRASRLGVDLHYNPPGIRGEPRYLEGVARFTKLHGSIDWRQTRHGRRSNITRFPLPFGALNRRSAGVSTYRNGSIDELIVYPNAAKDIETLEYPYAELFRDLAAEVCRPNAVVVTYGYGFGDGHINRILRDMLTIPSTHLAIISYDQAQGRIKRFCREVGRQDQLTILLGDHFADLTDLTRHYLPKPAIDQTTWRMVELLNRRTAQRDLQSTDSGASQEGES